MTSISRNTGHTLLFVFAVSYALLVAWCIFFPSDETDGDILLYHGGQGYEMQRPSVSPVQFSPSASAPSFAGGSAPRKFRLRGSSYGGGGSYQGGYAFSSRAFSPAGAGATGGLYTTSSAQVHSYGGGTIGMQGRESSASQTPAAEGWSGVSAVSITPTLAFNQGTQFSAMLMPESNNEEGNNHMMLGAPAASTSAGVWKQGAYYSPVRSAATTGWMSAEDWLDGARSSGIRKEPGANTPDPIANWLASLAGSGLGGYSGTTDGIGYFDEATLKAYYESLCSNPDNMPGFTWDEVKAWFAQGGDNPLYSFTNQNPTPVGDAWALLLLALGYTLYKYLIEKQKRTQTWLTFGSKKDKK